MWLSAAPSLAAAAGWHGTFAAAVLTGGSAQMPIFVNQITACRTALFDSSAAVRSVEGAPWARSGSAGPNLMGHQVLAWRVRESLGYLLRFHA